MGRKRISKFKAWPLLIILALVYWSKEHLGIKDVSDVESFSEAVLPLALILLFLAGGMLLIFKLRRKKKKKDKQEERI